MRIVVLGAGLAGASAAWHLAGRAEVVLVEQGDQPGAEASAQNAGMVRRLGHDPVERALACRSMERLLALGPDWEDCPPLRRTGAAIGLGEDPRALDAAVADLRRRGIAVEEVSPAAAGRVAPALAGSPLKRLWWLPEECVADPSSLLQGFLKGARRRGAQLLLRRRGAQLRLASGRVEGVETEEGPILGDAVLLAAGAWSGQLARAVGLDRPLTPLARHLLFTGPHPLFSLDHPWCWVDDAGVYARPEGGGWLCSPCDETPVEPAPGPGSARPPEELGRALLMEKLSRWLPALGPVRPARGWMGLRTFAPDRRPYLGPDPEIPGLFWLTGLGGFGLTCGFAAGEFVAEQILGGSPGWIDPTAVAPSR